MPFAPRRRGSCSALRFGLVVAAAAVAVFLSFAPLSLRGAGPPAGPSPRRDIFGGIGRPVAAGTGFFRLQLGSERGGGRRWLLLTPTGRPMWLRGVFAVDWSDGGAPARAALRTRFGGDEIAFAADAARRIESWGFNALGAYASSYALPVPTYFRPRGNSVRLPFIRCLNVSWYGAINAGGLAPAPFKTLLAGAVDPAIYHGWPGHVPDVFDPNFALYARRLAADEATATRQTVFTAATARGGDPQPSLARSPWLLATSADDADYLFGFGPGPAHPGVDGTVHPNIGWIIAVTKPEQRENKEVGAAAGNARAVVYADPVVYAKRAWESYLERKYHTIAALNAAWGSDYTTFGSDGGWPTGRGVLDENGRHAWIGRDPYSLRAAAPAARADMNAFLAVYAEQYFRVTTAAIRAAAPRQLVLGPEPLDSHGGMSRPEVLRAAARYCDLLEVAPMPENPGVLAATYAVTGKPMIAWIGLRADRDSPLAAVASPSPSDWVFPTQAARGAAYARAVARLYAARTPAGVAPVVGLIWWEYMDKPSEGANWGLVTARDNAYDGREDRPAGGEARDYGDFLDAVAEANRGVDRALAAAARRR